MNILWLINIPLPEASSLLNEIPQPFGGWLVGLSKELAHNPDITLSIAFPKKGIKNIKTIHGEKLRYFAVQPVTYKDSKLIDNNKTYVDLLNKIKPDLVHIHGTEFAHSLAMVHACRKENIKSVISIQGLVSIYEKHMYANLPFHTIYAHTIRNLLRGDSIWGIKKQFALRGQNEIKAIKNTDNIIGRTTWDKACTAQINPNAKYYFCNETLRDIFYESDWNVDTCEKYSILSSQGQYPIKGLHYLLHAMPLILKQYPEAKLYVGGKNITKSDSFKDRFLLTYYGKYILRMIKTLNLDNKIIFTGPLDEKQMKRRYLQSNVFVCPSSIENSPNSLGEAMILGVPCVASHVGGIPDMLEHNKEGFVYQTDAPYMLAYYVCEIFKNRELALHFSQNARKHALITHNKETNTKRLLEIYNKILELPKI